MTEQSSGSQSDPYLLQLILSLEAAAMQQMGKLQNPFTGKIEKNLEVAKNSIEMLAMIERKTDGNLTSEEGALIKRVLYQLRMNYVDELESEEKAEKSAPDTEPDEHESDAGADSGETTIETEKSEDGEPK